MFPWPIISANRSLPSLLRVSLVHFICQSFPVQPLTCFTGLLYLPIVPCPASYVFPWPIISANRSLPSLLRVSLAHYICQSFPAQPPTCFTGPLYLRIVPCPASYVFHWPIISANRSLSSLRRVSPANLYLPIVPCPASDVFPWRSTVHVQTHRMNYIGLHI